MKLILDSETLSINYKMADVQEVFLEQPLSNGLTEDIKNGDICNGSSEVTEDTNGIDNAKNKTCESVIALQENDKSYDEITENRPIEESRQTLQKSNSMLKESELEEDIKVAVPVDDILSGEASQSIEEPVKSPATIKENPRLQENRLLDGSIKTDANPTADSNTREDKSEGESNYDQDMKVDKVSSYLVEDIRPVKSVLVAESDEKGTGSITETENSTNICDHVEMTSEPAEINGAINNTIKNESDTMVIDDTIKTDTMEIDEVMSNKPNNKPIDDKNVDSVMIDDTTKPATIQIDEHAKKENAVEGEKEVIKFTESSKKDAKHTVSDKPIEGESVEITRDAIKNDNTNDEIIIKPESVGPIADHINKTTDEVDKCFVSEKTVTDSDFKASTDEAKDTEIINTPMETDLESSDKAKEEFTIIKTDLKSDSKESLDKASEVFEVIETEMETNFKESSVLAKETPETVENPIETDSLEKSTDVIETDAKESTNKAKEHFKVAETHMETDAKESTDKVKEHIEVVKTRMETDAKGSTDKVKEHIQVVETRMETDAKGSTDKVKEHIQVVETRMETEAKGSTDKVKEHIRVVETRMETDAKGSTDKDKEHIQVVETRMETDAKGSTDKVNEHFKVVDIQLKTDAKETTDKATQHFKVVETHMEADTIESSDKANKDSAVLKISMETDAKRSSDLTMTNSACDHVSDIMETDAKESADKAKGNFEVVETQLETEYKEACKTIQADIKADTIESSDKAKENSAVIKTSMETNAKRSSDCTMTNSACDGVNDTTNNVTPIKNATETETNITAKKSKYVIEIDCNKKDQVIDIDGFNKDTASKTDKVNDAVFNCEDSSDGCTVVEAKEKAATDNQQMDVDSPLENKEAESNKPSSDLALDVPSKPKSICGLSNTLDIISDDEDEAPPTNVASEIPKEDAKIEQTCTDENKCINLDDDDDIMLIDEDLSKEGKNRNVQAEDRTPPENVEMKEVSNSSVVNEDSAAATKLQELLSNEKDRAVEDPETSPIISEKEIEMPVIGEKPEKTDVKLAPDTKPLVPANFLKTFKSNVAEMTRDDLEEFCLIKIVEGIVEKSNLSEIKVKLKTMAQSIDEWRKKAMMLTKQNRDLQIVLKTVQEEQKKKPDLPITPLKITRSVGMQVFMTEANERGVIAGKRGRAPGISALKAKPLVVQRQQPKPTINTPIPVPRLVPATASSPAKPRSTTQVQSSAISSNSGKPSPAATVKTPPVKVAEKRPLSTGPTSFTVDLTDDEPPAKQMPPRQAPVRVVSQHHLMAPRAQVSNVNSPRKVYIPINSQNQNQLRQGNTVMLKTVAPMGPRQRPPMVRLPNNSATTVRTIRPVIGRHPAPLPDVAKQQQPPNWKALPPSPDLKISKVENGIVISWKIDGYQEDSYEEIASYQLYAYQETSSPPSTLLWKKIGDVKALPLPMACTLTQFMAGYKYYFAVRAVDIRSRIGPFSLPGSILLLNK